MHLVKDEDRGYPLLAEEVFNSPLDLAEQVALAVMRFLPQSCGEATVHVHGRGGRKRQVHDLVECGVHPVGQGAQGVGLALTRFIDQSSEAPGVDKILEPCQGLFERLGREVVLGPLVAHGLR